MRARRIGQLVGGEAHAETELGIVLEQRIVPGRPPALGVGRVRRGRQVATVDRRTAGGIGDQHAVAEQLRGEPDVRRFATADAGTGKLEERRQQHGAGHGAALDDAPVVVRQLEEELPVFRFLRTQRRLLGHVQGLARDIGLVADRADLDAQRAARAILGRHLVADVPARRVILAARRHVLERRRGVLGQFSREGLGADRRMRADEDALAALRAQVGFEHRDL